MFKQFILGAAIALLTFAPAQADDLADNIKEAEQLGQEIYNQDIAAWVATDDLLAYIAKNESFAARIGGWISYADGRKYKTIFFDKDSKTPRALYEVTSKKRKVKDGEAIDRDLSDREMGLWRARALTLTQDFEACAEYSPYNSVVVEKENGDGYYAYLFAATKEQGLIVLGRHYRFDINKAATEVRGVHAFTKTCFALPLSDVPDGAQTTGLMTTHLVSDYPQEHHIFANLMWDIDLFVSAGDKIWQVSDGKIDLVD